MQGTMTLSGRQVAVRAGAVTLEGELTVPEVARGLVLFAHGSGSSRRSPRNRFVAATLVDADLATLLFDLLTDEEESIDRFTAHLRFDIPLLCRRLLGAIEWAAENPEIAHLDVGLFGSSTGGGAALLAAAQRPGLVSAVVCRGGRPDLAGEALEGVDAPTLLIVGARDTPVLELNRKAMARMPGLVQFEIVPGAGHLFEESGALEQVARSAAQWFRRYLGASQSPASAA